MNKEFIYYLFPLPQELNILSDKQANLSSKVQHIHDSSLKEQSYKIHIKDELINCYASSPEGHYWAEKTIKQLKTIANYFPVYEVEIFDAPDFLNRGAMLDISRDKIHSITYLKDLISMLSDFKINHLELYCEHAFQYKDHPTVWKDATAYSKEEIDEIKEFANQHHIRLVANQNTLGHMERWLIHDKYQHLAYMPGGFRDNFGMLRPPTTLNPTNHQAMKLVRDLVTELDDSIGSSQFNINLDEPWELIGKDPQLWLNWLKELTEFPVLKDKEVLIWGDYLAANESLVKELPENVEVIEWGYEYNHPFGQRIQKFIENSKIFWAAPGTSSWLSIVGRFENMVKNISSCVNTCKSAKGILNTDWGDFGHLQPPVIAECGLIFGAVASWRASQAKALSPQEVASLADLHTQGKLDSIYKAVFEISKYQDCFPLKVPNMTGVITNLYFPQLPSGSGFTTGVDAKKIKDALEILDNGASLLTSIQTKPEKITELKWAVDLVKLLLKDHLFRLEADKTITSVQKSKRDILKKELTELINQYHNIYTLHFRDGGYNESVRWLTHLYEVYETGQVNPDWSGPLSEAFYKKHPLPDK